MTRQDILDAAGSVQLCSGQMAGREAADAMWKIVEDDTEAVLEVDATNAFNCLNRKSPITIFSHYVLPLFF